MKIFLSTIILLSSINIWAAMPAQMSLTLGTISTNYAESESTIKSTDGTTSTEKPYSGTASSMPFELGVEYFPSLTKSFFFRGGGPLMASTSDRYFYVNGGFNFYFSSYGAPTKVADQRIEIKMTPKFRYYAGPSIGTAYLVYNTESKTKNDIMLELGAQVGALYLINSKWCLKAEANIARGIGAIQSSMTMKLLLGATYNLNN